MGNQSKYRTWREVLIEHSLDAVVGMDKNHKVIDWNLQAEKTFGWNRDYILGKSLPEHLIPKEFHEAHFLGLKRFLATGEAHIIDKRVELEALTRSGKRIPIELTVSPVEIDNELFFYAFLRDISDRKERENEIHSYRQTLENVLMHAPFAISLRQGPGHRFVYVNKAYEDLSGKKLSEIEGKTQDEAFPELSQTDMRRIYDVCFDRGETIVKEEFFIPASQSPTKTPKYCKLIMQPLFDQDNKVTGLVSFIQDISKAVEARKHAEQVAYQIRLIIDASPAFIAFVDRDFRYQFTNKHYEHIFNIDSRTIKDTPIIDVIGKETFEKSLPFYQKALSGESAHLDSSITAKNGDKLYLDIQYVPFRPDKEVLGMVIIAHDITERKIESDDQKLLAELTSYYAINAEESEIIAKATELLARRLNASRCWIAEASQEHSISVVHQNYTDGVSSLVGKWDLNNFGKEMVSAWRSGRIVYVNDVMTDSRTKDSAAAHMSIDIRSFISVPLHRGGKLMALLDISCEYPRNWTNRELEIARAVCEEIGGSFIESSEVQCHLRRDGADIVL